MMENENNSISLHSTQKEVAVDNHDYRVVCCGRQWGKTTLAVLEMVAFAYSSNNKEVAYFATTFDQARNIAWNQLKKITKPIWAKEPNESRLELTIRTQDKGTSKLTLRGFENIETARGQQFDFLVIDEVASMKNWKYAWEAILEPTLAFRKGKALFISTPQGLNFFYDMFMKGQIEDPDWKSWRFTSYDNPFLDKERIDTARRNNAEDYFMQEYMAEFRSYTGLAHKAWERQIHFIEPFEVPMEWPRFRGFDFGTNDPTSSVRFAVNDGVYFLERCYKRRNEKISEHAEIVSLQDHALGYVPKWGDPSGKQWFLDMEAFKVFIEPANKEVGQGFKGWVEYCVKKVNDLLQPTPGHTVRLPDGREIKDAPHLFVLKTDENLAFVKEIEALRWKETTNGEFSSVLEDSGDPDGHFDLLAATRYALVSYNGQRQTRERIQSVVHYNRSRQRRWGLG